MTDLTDKQKLFIEHYLACWNATEAARRAGYQGNDNTLGSVGWENLQKPAIAERIKQRISEAAMAADEVLARLADQARATMADFIDIVDEIGSPVLNLEKAAQADKLHLVKKLRYNAKGYPEIELHDAQAALVHIGRSHGLFKERYEHTGAEGGPIETKDVTLSDDRRIELISQLLDAARERGA